MKAGTTTLHEAYERHLRQKERERLLKETGIFSYKVAFAGVAALMLLFFLSWQIAVAGSVALAGWITVRAAMWYYGNQIVHQEAKYTQTLVNIDKLERELDGQAIERPDGLQYVACECGSRSMRMLVPRGETPVITGLSGRKLVIVCASCRQMYDMHFVER